MSADRGVQRDIWERNNNKTLGLRLQSPGLVRLLDAMRVAASRKPSRFLGMMIADCNRGGCRTWFPTEAQLRYINDHLVQRGLSKVSCPVRLSQDEHKRRKHVVVDADVARLVGVQASRPLKPPRAV